MKKTTLYILSIVGLILLLWVNLCILGKIHKKNPNVSSADAWDVEIMKVGGQENRDKIEKIYKNKDYIEQQTQAIDQTITQFNDETSTETQLPSESNADVSELVENLLATAPVRGNKDARFTIIEYTELLCPYCQRHSANGTIQAVMDKYPGEVNSVSRHYIIHGQTALELAAAMECVAELKSEVYYDAFEKAFEAYPVDMDTLKNIAVELGVNSDNLQKCIDEGRYTQSVNDMMNQGRTVFGIQGTPGNVIFDRETGKYQVLPGAYPAEEFYKMIDSMK